MTVAVVPVLGCGHITDPTIKKMSEQGKAMRRILTGFSCLFATAAFAGPPEVTQRLDTISDQLDSIKSAVQPGVTGQLDTLSNQLTSIKEVLEEVRDEGASTDITDRLDSITDVLEDVRDAVTPAAQGQGFAQGYSMSVPKQGETSLLVGGNRVKSVVVSMVGYTTQNGDDVNSWVCRVTICTSPTGTCADGSVLSNKISIFGGKDNGNIQINLPVAMPVYSLGLNAADPYSNCTANVTLLGTSN